MREALVASALRKRAQGAKTWGLPGDRIVLSCKVSGVQDLIAVYRDLAARCDYPLHLGLTEAGMGSKGIVASTAAHGGAAAGRHRRHDPRFAHAGAGRRPHARSHRRAGDPADHGAALVHADGDRVPRLRAHHQHVLPGARRQHPELSARADAGVAHALSGRRRNARRGDGLRGQRPGRKQARQHRHQPAGLGREPGGAGLRRRREDRDAERRAHRRRVPAPRRAYVRRNYGRDDGAGQAVATKHEESVRALG